ncbi:MAG: hypothetical protein N2Z74_09140 [Syntrophales bacterium]|nr:hypothetical protein [Syntrophales bacterium]
MVTALMAVAGQIMAGLTGHEAPPIPESLGLLKKLDQEAGEEKQEPKIQHFIPGAPDVLAI